MMAASSLARGSMILRWGSPTQSPLAAASLLPRLRPTAPTRPPRLRTASAARPAPSPPPPPPRLPISRRALSTMLPVHTAVASARLVTSLPREAGAVLFEGANAVCIVLCM
ncbi:hypothetical protein Taro_025168 [Colocasia esculenta]|uniref:Uncharacterized protein n=1 Tax=Colocasia esculenta TaxID=4460 RepID=A0A843VGS6_COLES|nr:hypothetical protein [Colocasia esculenta]